MKNSEKILIEDLFRRLKDIEKKTSDRDKEAEEFILGFLNCNKYISYYMVQTILIQETAINELNNKIKSLEKEVFKNNIQKGSFLSGYLKNKVLNTNSNAHLSENKNFTSCNQKYDKSFKQCQDYNSNNLNSRSGRFSSFLGNALQTAIGVAGGMVAGNMLTNLFRNKEENNMIDNDENTVSDSYIQEEKIDSAVENNTIDQDSLNYLNDDENNFESVDYNNMDLDDINYD